MRKALFLMSEVPLYQVHSLREELSGARSREASLSLSLSLAREESLGRSLDDEGGEDGGGDPSRSEEGGEGGLGMEEDAAREATPSPSGAAGSSHMDGGGEASPSPAAPPVELSPARHGTPSPSDSNLEGGAEAHAPLPLPSAFAPVTSPSRSDGVEGAVRSRPDASQGEGGLGEATERLALAVRTLPWPRVVFVYYYTW